jgi:regulator of replication initiation timing
MTEVGETEVEQLRYENRMLAMENDALKADLERTLGVKDAYEKAYSKLREQADEAKTNGGS